jgi:hypothetical protein
MMSSLRKTSAFALIASLAAGFGAVAISAAPAAAYVPCGAYVNIGHVTSRTSDVIRQLNHDVHDYGGHKLQAMQDLIAARQQLFAARAFAVANEGANPACFQPASPLYGPAFTYEHGQGGSNRFIGNDFFWIGNLVNQLERDGHDYDGHRVAALNSMMAARGQLGAAERYAQNHGY